MGEAIDMFIPPDSLEEQWDTSGLSEYLRNEYNFDFRVRDWIDRQDEVEETAVRREIENSLDASYLEKEKTAGASVMREFEKNIMLQVLDSHWKEHLASMDYLRQGIHLRGFAQKNPKQEYKREAFEFFSEMLSKIMRDVVGILQRVDISMEDANSPRQLSSAAEKQATESTLLSKNKRKEQRKRRKRR